MPDEQRIAIDFSKQIVAQSQLKAVKGGRHDDDKQD